MKNVVIILDNTHTRGVVIDGYYTMFDKLIKNGLMEIYVKHFEIPLWKAKLRNIWRNWRTGKNIPNDVMESMYKNYNKLNKTKYPKYE